MSCGVPTLRLRRERLLVIATRTLGSRARAEAWLTAAGEGELRPADRLATLEEFLSVVEEAETLTPPG
jgi:hypothetical protein